MERNKLGNHAAGVRHDERVLAQKAVWLAQRAYAKLQTTAATPEPDLKYLVANANLFEAMMGKIRNMEDTAALVNRGQTILLGMMSKAGSG